MTVESLLSRLKGVRQVGDSRWKALCPSHDDHNPSLSVALKDDGRILIHCFAGCDAADVLQAIGLGLRDLFPDGPLGHHFRAVRPPVNYRAILRVAARSARILELCAEDLAEGRPLSVTDRELVRQAYLDIERIADRWAR